MASKSSETIDEPRPRIGRRPAAIAFREKVLVWIAAAPEGSQPPRSDVKVLRPGVARDRKHLERMLELLEPYRGHRFRVIRLLLWAMRRAPHVLARHGAQGTPILKL